MGLDNLSERDLSELVVLMQDQGRADPIFMGRDILGYELIMDHIHELPAAFLMDKTFHEKLWLWPRGSIKSTLSNVVMNLMDIVTNPQITILLGSEGLERNEKWVKQLENRMERCKLFRLLYGDLVNLNDWQQTRFTVRSRLYDAKGNKLDDIIDLPTVSVASIDQPKTGDHYDNASLDDVVIQKNSDTHEQREKAVRFIDFVDTLLKDSSIKRITGTPYHFQDAYWRKVEAEAQAVKDGEPRTIGILLGSVYDPDEFAKGVKNNKFLGIPTLTDRMMEKLARNNPTMFATQYMCNPVAGAIGKFSPQWIKFYKPDDLLRINPQSKLQEKRPMFVFTTFDPGEGQTRKASYSAMITAGVCGNPDDFEIFTLDARRGRWNPDEVVDNFYDVYLTYQPLIFGIETIAFQAWIARSLNIESEKRGMYLPITELEPSRVQTKEYEILSLAAWLSRGRVKFLRSQNDTISEFISYPKGSSDYLRCFTYLAKILSFPESGASANTPQAEREREGEHGYPRRVVE
ncbi:MAG: hypothetical protein PHY56_00070 [Candidatus Omnitrophica bacterium]|nr:hypothetical protein [Candidatus Omnitrophota bacterium]